MPPEQPGMVVTLADVYNSVNLLSAEVSKLKTQLAAHAVIVGILTAVIVFLIQKGIA